MVAKNGSARKLFTLDGDTEGSDAEEDPERDQDRERAAARERIRQEEIQAIAAAAEAQRQADAELQHEEEEERARDEANRMAMVSEAEMERLRTGTRRYHALMELLATEVGYLMDLRALVTVRALFCLWDLGRMPGLCSLVPASPRSTWSSSPH